MKTLDRLSTADKKAIRNSVIRVLEKYRICKAMVTFEEREASITTNYQPRHHSSKTNRISDETAQIATYNVDTIQSRKDFCDRVEWAVNQLPAKEKFLITERYMIQEAEYVTDYVMYNHRFDPPISVGTYALFRDRAMFKLAQMFGITTNPEKGGET